jgi:hypothetical protein
MSRTRRQIGHALPLHAGEGFGLAQRKKPRSRFLVSASATHRPIPPRDELLLSPLLEGFGFLAGN